MDNQPTRLWIFCRALKQAEHAPPSTQEGDVLWDSSGYPWVALLASRLTFGDPNPDQDPDPDPPTSCTPF